MKDIPDKYFNLIVTDPPYNIKKADWDKWKKESDYIDWCLTWIKECERALKDNGSFYFFHNDMEVIAELMGRIKSETKFVFKQMIVWNKRFPEASNTGILWRVLYMLRNIDGGFKIRPFYTSYRS